MRGVNRASHPDPEEVRKGAAVPSLPAAPSWPRARTAHCAGPARPPARQRPQALRGLPWVC